MMNKEEDEEGAAQTTLMECLMAWRQEGAECPLFHQGLATTHLRGCHIPIRHILWGTMERADSINGAQTMFLYRTLFKLIHRDVRHQGVWGSA